MQLDKKQLIKYGVIALVAIIILVALIVLINKFGKGIGNKLTEKQQERLNQYEIDEDDLSISPTEIQNLVTKLHSAFGVYGAATDEDSVYEVFETLETRSDILALVNAFGVHKNHTLNEWMNKELSLEELDHVQQILSAKGIVYTF